MLFRPRKETNEAIGKIVRLMDEGMLKGLAEQSNMYCVFDNFLVTERISLVLMPESNFFYNSHLFIRAAHRHCVPVAVIPYTIANTLEWAEAFLNSAPFQADKGLNRIFAFAFPHWVLKHRGSRLILPPAYILECESFDMVPNIPWLLNSGDVDALAAESLFMAGYYLRSGIRKEKIRITGALSDDRLFSLLSARGHYRKIIGDRFGIPIGRKIVLIGLPPDQFGAGKRLGCEFVCYQDLIQFLVGTVTSFSGSAAAVLINLHPRINNSNVAWLTKLGCTIVDEPIENIVPLADIYIAVASATVRLGISCGIPVVNYDAYQYHYDDYEGLEGVCEVNSKHDYEDVVNSLIHDQLFYAKIKEAQKATADDLCNVDGKAGERLLNLFDHLTATDARLA